MIRSVEPAIARGARTGRTRIPLVCLAVVLSCAGSRPAAAQEAAIGTPPRSLYPPVIETGANTRTAPLDTLRLSARGFGALERETARDAGDTTANGPSSRPGTPFYTGFQFDLSRVHSGPRLSYDLQASSQLRRYQGPGGLTVDSQGMAASLRGLVTKRTAVTASQRVTYAPFYAPAAPGPGVSAPDAEPSVQLPRGSAALASVTVASAVALLTQVSARTTAAVEYQFDRTDFSSTGTAVVNHRASATLTRALRRDLTVRFRYTRLWSATAVRVDRTTIDTDEAVAGLTYSPPVSQRTTVAFGVEPHMAARRQPAGATRGALDPTGASQIGLGGFSQIDHLFTRDWRAGLAYQRTLYYLPGYDRAIVADLVTGRMEGNLGGRLLGTLSNSYSRGTTGGAASHPRITSLSLSARLDFRPSGSTSVYGEYLADAYTMSGDVSKLPGVAGSSRRSAIRVGVAMGVGSGRSRPAGGGR